MEELYKQLAALARQHGARRLVLFGSRARGDNRYNSDVDLAVYGMPEGNRANFWMDCEDLPTLLKFDIVHTRSAAKPCRSLRQNTLHQKMCRLHCRGSRGMT